MQRHTPRTCLRSLAAVWVATMACSAASWAWDGQGGGYADESWRSGQYGSPAREQPWAGTDYGYAGQTQYSPPPRHDNPWAIPRGYGYPSQPQGPRPWGDVPSQERERSARRPRASGTPPSDPSQEYPAYGGYYGGYSPHLGSTPNWGGSYPGLAYPYDPYYGGYGGTPWGGSGMPFGGPGWGSPLGGWPFFGGW